MPNNELHEQELMIKLVDSTLKLLELEKQKQANLEKLIETLRWRIIFGLPAHGSVGVHRRTHREGWREVGEVHVTLNGEVVHKVDVMFFDEMDKALSKASTPEEFREIHRELVAKRLGFRLKKPIPKFRNIP